MVYPSGMTSPSATGSAPASYCADQIRRLDPDRYLTALFASGARRDALFALYAFNLEVARTREMVREPMMGLMRLQWWRDAIDEIYAGRARRHQVAEPLAEAIRGFGLAREPFDRLLDARERDVDPAAPRDMQQLLDYAEGTSATLVRLALQVLGGADRAQDAAREAGIAWALIGLLRAVPFHARAKRLYLPEDVIERHGVTTGALFELRGSPPLSAAVEEVAEAALRHVEAARKASRRLPRRVLPALLPVSLAALYLARMRQARYDVFDRRVQEAPPGRIWRLAGHMLIGRI
jgi:phytoene synthase